jgi:glycosyltransferase involved in cell wall biosynthesis
MKVGVVIPDRGDRPQFTDNCVRMMKRQTLQPYRIAHVNYPPTSPGYDIVARYKTGYDLLKDFCDVIAFIENDDWYHPMYLELMSKAWESHGRPELFGIDYTINCHLRIKSINLVRHPGRASMNSTLMRGGLRFPFSDEMPPYLLDQRLWSRFRGVAIGNVCSMDITISMKHGLGLCGGKAHSKLDQYPKLHPETLPSFLRHTLDYESYEFYTSLQL